MLALSREPVSNRSKSVLHVREQILPIVKPNHRRMIRLQPDLKVPPQLPLMNQQLEK